eukprot:TRINITY_DN3381_c0_g1_i1.p1 TRINITY_DN3381_c0_g1~~TRINITY_DN3381_c0_g1_i1.p1  ORF type:complete len:307 (+),score=69.98 TRINITY_DN3381_c0_g1_i1:95-922(+)
MAQYGAVVQYGEGVQMQGIVKSWNDEKGFGFIGPPGGEAPDAFVMRSHFGNFGCLVMGQQVTYTAKENDRKPGQMLAITVTGPGVDRFGGCKPQGVPQGHVRGTVLSWNREKGFGFVSPPAEGPAAGGPDVFCHRREFSASPLGELIVGQTVFYRADPNMRKPGQFEAKAVVGPGVSADGNGPAPMYAGAAGGAGASAGGGWGGGGGAPYQQGAPAAGRQPASQLYYGGGAAQGSAPVAQNALPPGWEEYVDDDSGRTYWHNHLQGRSVWTRPTA